VAAEDAAAERPGNEQEVPGLRPAARDRPRAAISPITVTEMTSFPSQLLVSPPTIAMPNRSATSRSPK